MRGDLILYKTSGKWYERLITLATHGPFVHVAIMVDETRVIAADTQGIRYDVLPLLDRQHALLPLLQYASPVDIERGLAWAMQQTGKEYGWLDIAYQGVKFLAPNNPFRFGEVGHYDCSDLATRYLQHCGVQLPDDYDPYTVTPNDLARWAGILAPRKAA